uniref:RING-type domain-containing protein n=1 Tax=Soybean thrips tombus-like virus 1 TaxID=2802943 RepID=A0A7T8FZR6_9TOMB|nr:hypothetical protein 1 [Soybean thrips tombus-like virus 1]
MSRRRERTPRTLGSFDLMPGSPIVVVPGLCPPSSQDAVIVHCIGADHTLGAGYAATLSREHVRQLEQHIPLRIGQSYHTEVAGSRVVHLVTKPLSAHPPREAKSLMRAAVHAQRWLRNVNVICPALAMGRDRRSEDECTAAAFLLRAQQTTIFAAPFEFRKLRVVAERRNYPVLESGPWMLRDIPETQGMPHDVITEDNCALCLDRPTNVWQTNCYNMGIVSHHLFCRTCLSDHLRRTYFPPMGGEIQPTCPLCRTRFSIDDVFSILGRRLDYNEVAGPPPDNIDPVWGSDPSDGSSSESERVPDGVRRTRQLEHLTTIVTVYGGPERDENGFPRMEGGRVGHQADLTGRDLEDLRAVFRPSVSTLGDHLEHEPSVAGAPVPTGDAPEPGGGDDPTPDGEGGNPPPPGGSGPNPPPPPPPPNDPPQGQPNPPQGSGGDPSGPPNPPGGGDPDPDPAGDPDVDLPEPHNQTSNSQATPDPSGPQPDGNSLLNRLNNLLVAARQRALLSIWGTPADGVRYGRVRQALMGFLQSRENEQTMTEAGITPDQVMASAARDILTRAILTPQMTPQEVQAAREHNALLLKNHINTQGFQGDTGDIALYGSVLGSTTVLGTLIARNNPAMGVGLALSGIATVELGRRSNYAALAPLAVATSCVAVAAIEPVTSLVSSTLRGVSGQLYQLPGSSSPGMLRAGGAVVRALRADPGRTLGLLRRGLPSTLNRVRALDLVANDEQWTTTITRNTLIIGTGLLAGAALYAGSRWYMRRKVALRE